MNFHGNENNLLLGAVILRDNYSGSDGQWNAYCHNIMFKYMHVVIIISSMEAKSTCTVDHLNIRYHEHVEVIPKS